MNSSKEYLTKVEISTFVRYSYVIYNSIKIININTEPIIAAQLDDFSYIF